MTLGEGLVDHLQTRVIDIYNIYTNKVGISHAHEAIKVNYNVQISSWGLESKQLRDKDGGGSSPGPGDGTLLI